MFVHLRCHSHYSFLRGVNPPEEIIAAAVEQKMPAVALTDTNGMYAAVPFLPGGAGGRGEADCWRGAGGGVSATELFSRGPSPSSSRRTNIYFMIRQTNRTARGPEPQSGQPAASGEGWLGRNQSEKRRLWERLNPRHRKELRMLAEALALEQNHARLPEAARGRLDLALAELDRVIRRIAAILAELARRTPPAG